jgi:hypothetical protein
MDLYVTNQLFKITYIQYIDNIKNKEESNYETYNQSDYILFIL